jgi:CCR4-NOT transcriptional regulation complex NOT5 subunit
MKKEIAEPVKSYTFWNYPLSQLVTFLQLLNTSLDNYFVLDMDRLFWTLFLPNRVVDQGQSSWPFLRLPLNSSVGYCKSSFVWYIKKSIHEWITNKHTEGAYVYFVYQAIFNGKCYDCSISKIANFPLNSVFQYYFMRHAVVY